MKIYKYVPRQMKQLDRWMYWKLETNENGKPTKIPYRIKDLKKGSSTRPSDWGTFEECIQNFDKTKMSGAAFAFTKLDKICFIDIDHCINNGVISAEAQEIMDMFSDTYQELSQSGTGVHIFCYGSIPKAVHTEIEMYDDLRYVALTAKSLNGKDLAFCQDKVNKLYDKYCKKEKEYVKPVITYNPQSESSIYECIKKSKNWYKFNELYSGIVEANSENTLSLASILAFWCAGDRNMIKSIMCKSGLYRPKFERPTLNKTWIDIVIDKAIQSCREYYNPQTDNHYKEVKITQSQLNDLDDYDYMSNFETFGEIKKRNKRDLIYVKTGYDSLDRKIGGYVLGQVSVWSGLNGSGKSNFLLQQMCETIRQGYKVMLFSGEMPDYSIKNSLYKILCNPDKLKPAKDELYWYLEDYSEEKRIDEWLKDNFYLYKNDCSMEVDTIIKCIRQVVKNKQVKVIVLDNLMTLNLKSLDKDKYEAQSIFAKMLAQLAKELGIHIHVVMHPRKAAGLIRKDDISGSADLSNAVDNVFIIHRIGADFVRKSKETLGFCETHPIISKFQGNNALEICKNREEGVIDEWIGFMFDKKRKTFEDGSDTTYIKQTNPKQLQIVKDGYCPF